MSSAVLRGANGPIQRELGPLASFRRAAAPGPAAVLVLPAGQALASY
jgi:hypothetical protein